MKEGDPLALRCVAALASSTTQITISRAPPAYGRLCFNWGLASGVSLFGCKKEKQPEGNGGSERKGERTATLEDVYNFIYTLLITWQLYTLQRITAARFCGEGPNLLTHTLATQEWAVGSSVPCTLLARVDLLLRRRQPLGVLRV